MKYEDTFTVKQLLHELNEYRRTLGEAPIKEWKQSRAKLIERVKSTNRAMLDDMDPMAIPAYLKRSNPTSFVHVAITPEMQARIDAAMAKSRTAVVASSFAQFDVPAKAPREKRVAKAPRAAPAADTFHLTILCGELKIDQREMRRIARASTEFLKPLEVAKYQYKDADQARILQHIAGKTKQGVHK